MRQLKVLNAVFLTIGLLTLGIGSWIAAGTLRLQRNGVAAEGHVIRLDRGSKGARFPVVEFQTQSGESVTFKSRSGSSPPSFRVGESVPVLYNPNDPQHASINTSWQLWGGAFIAVILGVVFTSIPGAVVLADWRKRRRIAWLKQYGQRISVQVDRIELVRSIRVNRISPYRIYVRGQNPFTGQDQQFQSDYLFTRTEPYLGDRQLDVLVDPNNPKRYWLHTGV